MLALPLPYLILPLKLFPCTFMLWSVQRQGTLSPPLTLPSMSDDRIEDSSPGVKPDVGERLRAQVHHSRN